MEATTQPFASTRRVAPGPALEVGEATQRKRQRGQEFLVAALLLTQQLTQKATADAGQGHPAGCGPWAGAGAHLRKIAAVFGLLGEECFDELEAVESRKS